jgi:hypothetical protein
LHCIACIPFRRIEVGERESATQAKAAAEFPLSFRPFSISAACFGSVGVVLSFLASGRRPLSATFIRIAVVRVSPNFSVDRSVRYRQGTTRAKFKRRADAAGDVRASSAGRVRAAAPTAPSVPGHATATGLQARPTALAGADRVAAPVTDRKRVWRLMARCAEKWRRRAWLLSLHVRMFMNAQGRRTPCAPTLRSCTQ